jgi:hypothetical protein
MDSQHDSLRECRMTWLCNICEEGLKSQSWRGVGSLGWRGGQGLPVEGRLGRGEGGDALKCRFRPKSAFFFQMSSSKPWYSTYATGTAYATEYDPLTQTGRQSPLEVESSDTIENVRQIRTKKESRRPAAPHLPWKTARNGRPIKTTTSKIPASRPAAAELNHRAVPQALKVQLRKKWFAANAMPVCRPVLQTAEEKCCGRTNQLRPRSSSRPGICVVSPNLCS